MCYRCTADVTPCVSIASLLTFARIREKISRSLSLSLSLDFFCAYTIRARSARSTKHKGGRSPSCYKTHARNGVSKPIWILHMLCWGTDTHVHSPPASMFVCSTAERRVADEQFVHECAKGPPIDSSTVCLFVVCECVCVGVFFSRSERPARERAEIAERQREDRTSQRDNARGESVPQ